MSKSLYCALNFGANLADDIVWRLQQLLCIHQQSYILFPQLGLPFLQAPHQQEQYSFLQWQQLLRQLIERYEPRLKNIDITLLESIKAKRLCFQIQADLQEVKQYFRVVMSDDIKVHQVEHEKYDN